MKLPFMPPPRRSSALPLGSVPGPKGEAGARSACLALAAMAVSGWAFSYALVPLAACVTLRDCLVPVAVAAMCFLLPGWFVGLLEAREMRLSSAVLLYPVFSLVICDWFQGLILRKVDQEPGAVAVLLTPPLAALVGVVLGHWARGKTVVAAIGTVGLLVALVAVLRA